MSDSAEKLIELPLYVYAFIEGKTNYKIFFVITEVKTQNTEKLVEDIGTLTENTEFGDIDLRTCC